MRDLDLRDQKAIDDFCEKMQKNTMHRAIADIHLIADKIKDFTGIISSRNEEEKRAIMQLCNNIQDIDKVLHDLLFPNCKNE